MSVSGTGNSEIENHIHRANYREISYKKQEIGNFLRILHENYQKTAKIKKLMTIRLVVLKILTYFEAGVVLSLFLNFGPF